MSRSTHVTENRPRRASTATWEFRTVSIDRGTSRADARKMLTDEAEYGRWELARTRLYIGGRRVVTLRRKVIRVASTLDGNF